MVFNKKLDFVIIVLIIIKPNSEVEFKHKINTKKPIINFDKITHVMHVN